MGFFFLSLRESQAGGRIEPDVMPSSSSSASLLPNPNTADTTSKFSSRYHGSAFSEYITTWDFDDKPALFRRCACILALVLHLPINAISILSHGISFYMFVGIVISVLNLFCLVIALWKLDVMRGGRLVYGKVYQRKHFDYIILGLVIVYGFFFGMFLFVRMRHNSWVWFLRIGWPFTIAADLVCFISGWMATWTNVSLG